MHRLDVRQLTAGLRRLGLRSYAAYTRSDWWRAFRLRRRAAGMTRCACCAGTRVALHHVTYARLGRERPADVVPLCNAHHRAAHRELDARGLRVTRTHEVLAGLGSGVARRRHARWHWNTVGPGAQFPPARKRRRGR